MPETQPQPDQVDSKIDTGELRPESEADFVEVKELPLISPEQLQQIEEAHNLSESATVAYLAEEIAQEQVKSGQPLSDQDREFLQSIIAAEAEKIYDRYFSNPPEGQNGETKPPREKSVEAVAFYLTLQGKIIYQD